MKRRHFLFTSLVFFIILFLSCASVIKNWRSSQTKRLKRTPYYTGDAKLKSDRIAHFSVQFDAGLAEFFEEGERRDAIIPLINAMNAHLDAMALSFPVDDIFLPESEGPQIYVGDAMAVGAQPATPEGEDPERIMVLKRTDPSKAWKTQLFMRADTFQADYFIQINIGFGNYFSRMRNLFGKKEIELGTGYKENIPWLTDLDTPMDVLHLTGALLDRHGNVLRAGAEGIIYKRTGFLAAIFDMQEILSPEDIDKLLNEEKRTELPGQPPKWQVALQNLVCQLLERDDLLVLKKD